MKYPRIRDLREDKDWSQKDIGEMLGIGQRSYAYYESGNRTLPPEILIALADLHNVSTDYLLDRTDIPTPYPKKG